MKIRWKHSKVKVRNAGTLKPCELSMFSNNNCQSNTRRQQSNTRRQQFNTRHRIEPICLFSTLRCHYRDNPRPLPIFTCPHFFQHPATLHGLASQFSQKRRRKEENFYLLWHMTCDMWQMTHDMWNVICDKWHVTCGEGLASFKISAT